MMIGRSGAYERIAGGETETGPAFRATYRTDRGESRITVHNGEIVGLAGLVGAGRTTFARALTGAPSSTAEVELDFDGRSLDIGTVRAAMAEGLVYLTEDRKRDGLFASLDIAANATAAALDRFAWGPFRRAAKENERAGEVLKRLRLVSRGLNEPVTRLSGGNQQKVVIGRALMVTPKLLVCDEPTRGVDVGAKAEIHRILSDLARDGVAILVISSELEELLAISHRIAIMHDRRFVADMPADATDEEQLLIAASGGLEAERQAS